MDINLDNEQNEADGNSRANEQRRNGRAHRTEWRNDDTGGNETEKGIKTKTKQKLEEKGKLGRLTEPGRRIDG